MWTCTYFPLIIKIWNKYELVKKRGGFEKNCAFFIKVCQFLTELHLQVQVNFYLLVISGRRVGHAAKTFQAYRKYVRKKD